MSAPLKKLRQSSAHAGKPVASESLCKPWSQTGRSSLESLACLIEQVAPFPGRVVYLHTTDLRMRMSGLEPVVFSAIDAATHMQVAQANFAATSGAALSFVEFVKRSFPFTIVEFKTPREAPFLNTEDGRKHRDFPTLVGERGFLHSFIDRPKSDALFSITSKTTFGEFSDGAGFPASPGELQRALAQFLFFHNNFRSVPWLDGRTPIQKLQTFARFHEIHSFNPMDESGSKLSIDGASPFTLMYHRPKPAYHVQKDHDRTSKQGKSDETNPRHRR